MITLIAGCLIGGGIKGWIGRRRVPNLSIAARNAALQQE